LRIADVEAALDPLRPLIGPGWLATGTSAS
jgi:hypothetical protein